ncbi:hypothetical protein VNO80_28139 [Phaseolus coccineus]|uniref:Uncharacterized protein n=1 Tax=Phaseolus coccineus TaxID=3886 RepID=A0AAN9LHH9_PHACN
MAAWPAIGGGQDCLGAAVYPIGTQDLTLASEVGRVSREIGVPTMEVEERVWSSFDCLGHEDFLICRQHKGEVQEVVGREGVAKKVRMGSVERSRLFSGPKLAFSPFEESNLVDVRVVQADYLVQQLALRSVPIFLSNGANENCNRIYRMKNEELEAVKGWKVGEELQKRIRELDARDDEFDLNEHEKEERRTLLADFNKNLFKQEAVVKQKARQKWLKQRDLNTKFFHSSVKWRKAKNELYGVIENGRWCENKDVVKENVRNFFEARFVGNEELLVKLDNVSFNSTSGEDNQMQVGAFSEEEIKEEVWSCDSSKSPSPNRL